MKKILSKFEKNERMDNSTSGVLQREASCFIGKQFTVGRTVVCVEDILAEGLLTFKLNVKDPNAIFIEFFSFENQINRWIRCSFFNEAQWE